MIFKLFRRTQRAEPFPTGPDILWAYPLQKFVNREEPFSAWEPPDTRIRSDLHDLCFCAVIGYVFYYYYYYVLIYKEYGSEVTSIVRAEHISRLNLAVPDFGDQLTDLLAIIESALESEARNDFRLPESGQQMPPEFYVATHFLFGIKESPYYGKIALLTERNGLPTPEVHEATFDVAECLGV
jgi:hypothetical protein